MPVFAKLGLIGDVHQEDDLLASVLAYFSDRRVDRVLCVGDIADGVGDFSRCIRLLQESAVECVVGNHDRWLLRGTMCDLPDALPASALGDEERSFLHSLPKTRSYETPGGRLLLCHGMGNDDMGVLLPDDEGYALESNFEMQEIIKGDYRFVVAGHTHRPMVRRLSETWFINPGTFRRDHGATAAVLDLAQSEVAILSVELGSVRVRDSVRID